MNQYFNGEKLYGDDFSFEEIRIWFNEESEGYADLGSKNESTYSYGYHMMNTIHGYNKIKRDHFTDVLGFGSAYGQELEPIINKITNLTIVEPSERLISTLIGNLVPNYVKPEIDGNLLFEDNSFDLITCFGTLHHISNVSFVLSELLRVLRPNGFLLLREPIVSMGDWRKARKGATKNERGIPIKFFDLELNKYPIQIVSKEYCFTLTSFLQRTCGTFFPKPIYSYKAYVIMDKYVSALLKNHYRYHATRKIDKVSPSNIFYVIEKT